MKPIESEDRRLGGGIAKTSMMQLCFGWFADVEGGLAGGIVCKGGRIMSKPHSWTWEQEGIRILSRMGVKKIDKTHIPRCREQPGSHLPSMPFLHH